MIGEEGILKVELGSVAWDGKIYITRNIKRLLNQQYDVLSLSIESMWLQIKEVYIDQIWSHKEYRVLCTRFDREGGTRVEQFFSSL